MRFLLDRFFKNIPFVYYIWEKCLNFIDAKYYDKNCTNYKIIPLGTYCLPRVITSLNRMKPKKFYGEKTTVFDLTFFNNLEFNADLIENNFSTLFDDLVYDEKSHSYKREDNKVIFYHEYEKSIPELKEIYSKRIDNFWEYFLDKTKFIYFLIAISTAFSKEEVIKLRNVLAKYRPCDEFKIIIINQSKQKIESFENIRIIDFTDDKNFEAINTKGTWALELKKQKTRPAKEFYKKINDELKEIIKNKE